MKILLVDDDAFLRDMYSTKFIECGHDVTAMDTSVGALRELETKKDYDLMLVDMIMPGMTGVDLMKKINELYPECKMKCIVLSNQGQEEDIAQAKAAGAIGYIIKAHSVPSEVVAKVSEILKDA